MIDINNELHLFNKKIEMKKYHSHLHAIYSMGGPKFAANFSLEPPLPPRPLLPRPLPPAPLAPPPRLAPSPG